MNVSRKTAKLFLEGDEQAASEVYYGYRSLLFFIISNYVRTKEDCEDVYQNVFVRIFERIRECERPSDLHYFLCSVAKNEAINFAKRNSLLKVEGFEEGEMVGDEAKGIDWLLPFDLTPEERSIVGYRIGYGLPWKEIVDLTGVPMSTAKLKYAQAMRKVRKELEK